MAAETVPAAGRAKHKLRWYQYSLRTLLLVMTLACVGMSWVAVKMKQARDQHAAVEAIKKLGGVVFYDYEADRNDPSPQPPGPTWLRRALGDDAFVNVTVVYLVNSGVNDAELEHLKGLPQLGVLSLYGTKVGDAGLENLKGLSHLREMSLCGTKVGDAGLEHLRGLAQLQTLFLEGTKISDAGLQYLEGLTQLQVLNLSHTKVSDAGIEHLKRLTKLKGLDLRDTNVTDAGAQDLQEALPKVEIVR
jgi:hypothetical protein